MSICDEGACVSLHGEHVDAEACEVESISDESVHQEFGCSVEDRASELLQQDCLISPSDLSSLFSSLPHEDPSRASGCEGASFSTGAFCRVKVGLRTNMSRFPKVSQLAARFVRQQLPNLRFTSIVMFQNVMTEPHVDAQNSFLPNAVCALSDFKDGQVWVERDGGDSVFDFQGTLRRGVDLSLDGSHAVFSARRLVHATRPWSGCRLVLVAFSISAVHGLSADHMATLRRLEFHVPSETEILNAEHSAAVCYTVPIVRDTAATATDEFPKTSALPPEPPMQIDSSGSAPSGPLGLGGCSGGSGSPAGASPERGFVLEIFARTGALSREFHQLGFEVMPIDKGAHRLPLAKLCSLDLALASSWQYLTHVLDQFPVRYIHVELPYATFGPTQGLRQLVSGVPVHSDNGDASIGSRLALADSLLSHVVNFLRVASVKSIIWTLEHPHSSFLWSMPEVRLLQVMPTTSVVYDLCNFGTPHRLRRQFLTTCKELASLNQTCQGNHPHVPIASGVETHPKSLCRQVAAAVAKCLGVATDDPGPAPAPPPVAQQRRGKAPANLLPEFGLVKLCVSTFLPEVDHKQCLVHPLRDIPAGSKLLAATPLGNSGDFELKIGVYASPEEFVEQARDLRHPFESFSVIPDVVKRKLFEALVKGPVWVTRHRVATLTKWLRWAVELEDLESELKESMEPEVRAVLGPKRLLLLSRIAEDLEWPDTDWLADTCRGFSVVGLQKPTGVFKKEPRPQERTAEDFANACKFIRPALLGKVRSGGVNEHSAELWQKTLDEVRDGFLEGPLTEDELDRRYGERWAPVRRFAVIQSSNGRRKLRPIDDYSENLVNEVSRPEHFCCESGWGSCSLP